LSATTPKPPAVPGVFDDTLESEGEDDESETELDLGSDHDAVGRLGLQAEPTTSEGYADDGIGSSVQRAAGDLATH
jgi:hypothetical protein